ncbi:hypothetical protein BTJ18_03915 [Lactobacillus delbrueckii subsp. bulgaricus]|nr:hypothetical protein [Lactobacillus delbrueckii subsp. bulgaricus]
MTKNDQERALLEKLHNNKCIIVCSNENRGFAAGNNLGLRELENCDSNYSMVINTDVIVDESALQACVSVLESNPKIALISPAMKNSRGEVDTLGAWYFPSYWQSIKFCTWFGRRTSYSNPVELDAKQYFIICDAVRDM